MIELPMSTFTILFLGECSGAGLSNTLGAQHLRSWLVTSPGTEILLIFTGFGFLLFGMVWLKRNFLPSAPSFFRPITDELVP